MYQKRKHTTVTFQILGTEIRLKLLKATAERFNYFKTVLSFLYLIQILQSFRI